MNNKFSFCSFNNIKTYYYKISNIQINLELFSVSDRLKRSNNMFQEKRLDIFYMATLKLSSSFIISIIWKYLFGTIV